MKPFSTPVLSKRTYRELKLLKHLRHENVSNTVSGATFSPDSLVDYQFERHLHLPTRGHVRRTPHHSPHTFTNITSYFVTELLGTDLHRLLTSRPLEKQFIQYFLYQILVRGESWEKLDT